VKIIEAIFVSFVSLLSAVAQTQEEPKIIRLDHGLDAIVSVNSKIETLVDTPGTGTRESPTWIRKGGYLIFSDASVKGIDKWDPRNNTSSVLLEKTESDGITLDLQGRIVWVGHPPAGGYVARLEKDGTRTILASQYEGKPLKRTNDLVYKSDGSLYFTDPVNPASKDISSVYLLKDGRLHPLLQTPNISFPNGLAFSPGEKYLYINDSDKKTITRFDVLPDDTIANGRLIVDMSAGLESCAFPCPKGYPDGMKVDRKGNIYVTGPGEMGEWGIWILSPEGKHLGTILIPDHPANLGFGDKDGKTLYITSRPGLYRVRLKVGGTPPPPNSPR
jgi:gluconolactonase